MSAGTGLPACPAIAAARAFDAHRRLPLHIGGQPVGSVPRTHLDALRHHAPWLLIGDGIATVDPRLASEPERSAAFERTHRALLAHGLLGGWRHETYAIRPPGDAPPLVLIERAAARFWGTLSTAVHLNGHVCGPDGQPTHLWIARRAWTKATDPGRLDNLVAGGVPHGQPPFDALVRECAEEAGLPEALARQARPGRVLHIRCDVPEGVHREQVLVHDLALPAGLQPHNLDGEVIEHHLMSVTDTVALLQTRDITTDAALATLDFLLRHRLLPASLHQHWAAQAAALWNDPDAPATA